MLLGCFARIIFVLAIWLVRFVYTWSASSVCVIALCLFALRLHVSASGAFIKCFCGLCLVSLSVSPSVCVSASISFCPFLILSMFLGLCGFLLFVFLWSCFCSCLCVCEAVCRYISASLCTCTSVQSVCISVFVCLGVSARFRVSACLFLHVYSQIAVMLEGF